MGGYLTPLAIRYGYTRIVQSTVGGGAIDAPSNVSRHTIWCKNHLKRRSFLVASSSPPWLNLYFCCYATKIKEKDHVRFADIHGSKSVRITSWLLRYYIPICRGDTYVVALLTPHAIRYGCNLTYESTVGAHPCVRPVRTPYAVLYGCNLGTISNAEVSSPQAAHFLG